MNNFFKIIKIFINNMHNDIDTEHLYHYTTLDRFFRISESKEFILSSFTKANDYKEKIRINFPDNMELSNYNYLSTVYDRNEKGMIKLSFGNGMMWHFYGDKGCGVCIEFLKEELLKTNSLTQGRITYRDGVSHIDTQTILEYLMEKRTCWAGENEYRFLYQEDIKSIPDIHNYISGIYFGPGVSDDDIKKGCRYWTAINKYKVYNDNYDGRYNRLKINNNQ